MFTLCLYVFVQTHLSKLFWCRSFLEFRLRPLEMVMILEAILVNKDFTLSKPAIRSVQKANVKTQASFFEKR